MSALCNILPLLNIPLRLVSADILTIQLPVVPCCSKFALTGGTWLLLTHTPSLEVSNGIWVTGRNSCNEKEIGSSLNPGLYSAEGEHVFYTDTTGIHWVNS